MAVAFETGAEPIPGYTLLDRLGSGGFGEVWRCEAPGGIFKAVKVIHGDLRYKDTDAYRFAEQELKSLKRVKQVRHPYLLALDRYDIVDGRLVIVMELADCNLWDRFRECRNNGLPGIPRDELLQYMSEAAEVLDLMNDRHQLQHLDIKPQNLFLLYNHVKVADFGQVKDLELHVAQVTGGITPVYAAPETFDGFVSRYCDQYSLACVYQELLTGTRPFDGTSMNQLLMQHLQQQPNLIPSPPADRPALARALAKKAEDRFPSVTALVRAIRDGTPAPAVVLPGASADSLPVEPSFDVPTRPTDPVGSPGTAFPDAGRSVDLPPLTPVPRILIETLAPARPAPPEQTGSGPLRPAVVIGIGYSGQRVLRCFHQLLKDRYGSTKRLPLVRSLYIDTDSDAIHAAGRTDESRIGPLPDECVVPTPLNRAAYYLRPRNNGRALIEGWLDPSVLYRLPRNPITAGLRSLGRLAFCDHYRTVMQKVQAEIDAVLDPIACAAVCNFTGLEIRTNRPRVYLVAGLGGGTGSGMVLDLAYAVKQRLRQMGYGPDVVGMLLLPPNDGEVSAQARANTYAALTELNHFSRPDTEYVGGYDDQHGVIRDTEPPFTRTHLISGYEYTASAPVTQTSFPSPRRSGSQPPSSTTVGKLNRPSATDPAKLVAELLRLDLFTLIGRVADEARGQLPPPNAPSITTSGLRRFGWPREAIVGRTSRVIAPVLLGNWVDPDPTQIRNMVPQWTDEQWRRIGLDPASLTARLQKAADTKIQGSITELVHQVIEPFTPKGWLPRLPEPQAVYQVFQRLTNLFGPPRESPNRTRTDLESAVVAEAKHTTEQVATELMTLIPALLDTQAFRLAGTEEVIRQLIITLQRTRQEILDTLDAREKTAGMAYDRLAHFVHQQKGTRKPTPTELADALRDYPTEWYQAVTDRQLIGIYTHLHDVLLNRLNELASCRQRIQEYHAEMIASLDARIPPPNPNDLLPLGCTNVEDAAQRFLKVLNDDDLNELEQRFQKQITVQLGGVFESLLNTGDGPQTLIRILCEVTRDYLNERMGEVDLYGMMKHKYGSGEGVGQAIAQALAEAEPNLVGNGPWAKSEVCLFAASDGPGGVRITQQATAVLPPIANVVPTADEVILYREFAQVPLTALDQFGPAWVSAYQAAPDLLQASPHTRTDITRWIHVDE